MVEVVAIVEGQTEQAFIRTQLARHLRARGVEVRPVLPGRTRKKGGVQDWRVAVVDVIRTLKERRCCTMMFDYYAMPADWPGRAASKDVPLQTRARSIEAAVTTDLMRRLGGEFDPRRFIPYVQMHEFEALLFSDPSQLAHLGAALTGLDPDALRMKLEQVVADAGHPEAIDDGYDTCPSRRISDLIRPYRKALHGPILADRIGLSALREKCPHFDHWVCRLESLAGQLRPIATD